MEAMLQAAQSGASRGLFSTPRMGWEGGGPRGGVCSGCNDLTCREAALFAHLSTLRQLCPSQPPAPLPLRFRRPPHSHPGLVIAHANMWPWGGGSGSLN